MKIIKHFWRYLTSPTYRFWIDFCSRQELIDKEIKAIKKALWLQTHPMFLVDGNKITNLNED